MDMKLQKEPFDAIQTGFKTIELRLYDDKRRKLQKGDTIVFSCLEDNTKTIQKKVSKIHVFSNFADLYSNLPLLKCGYTPFTLQKASANDMREYYTDEQQKKYGVVGIELNEEPLQRFTSAQTGKMPYCSSYEKAFEEIKNMKKESHWMWYVFPQIKGLTPDPVTEYYALKNREEAEAFLNHPVLGKRLKEITQALLDTEAYDPVSIFGYTDSYKLKWCMSLFSEISSEEDVFSKVLEQFCMGLKDNKTVQILSTFN